MILRQLGYKIDDGAAYDSAPAELADRGGLTASEAVKFTGKTSLIKDDLVGISFGSLKAKDSEGKSLISKLIDNKVVTAQSAEQSGLINTTADTAAEENVAAYEAAPLATDSEITAAEELGITAAVSTAFVTSANLKTALEARITAQKTRVVLAKAALKKAEEEKNKPPVYINTPSTAVSSFYSIYSSGERTLIYAFTVSPVASTVSAACDSEDVSIDCVNMGGGSYLLYMDVNKDNITAAVNLKVSCSGYDSSVKTIDVISETSLPEVKSVYRNGSDTMTITFSEQLSGVCKTLAEKALTDACVNGTLTFSWADAELTAVCSENLIFSDSVYVNLTDLYNNTNYEVLLIEIIT